MRREQKESVAKEQQNRRQTRERVWRRFHPGKKNPLRTVGRATDTPPDFASFAYRRSACVTAFLRGNFIFIIGNF